MRVNHWPRSIALSTVLVTSIRIITSNALMELKGSWWPERPWTVFRLQLCMVLLTQVGILALPLTTGEDLSKLPTYLSLNCTCKLELTSTEVSLKGSSETINVLVPFIQYFPSVC